MTGSSMFLHDKRLWAALHCVAGTKYAYELLKLDVTSLA